MRTIAALLVVLASLCSTSLVEAQPLRDGYAGTVTKSDKRKVGERFTFANLRTNRPFVTYPSGAGTETVKVFEDDDLIVLVFLASLSGSTETYYLNKKRNRFTVIEVGAMEAVVTDADFRPDVSHGDLR